MPDEDRSFVVRKAGIKPRKHKAVKRPVNLRELRFWMVMRVDTQQKREIGQVKQATQHGSAWSRS